MIRRAVGSLLTSAAVVWIASCGAGGSGLTAPIPENATNPVGIKYSGATKARMVDIVTKAVSDLGLTTIQADKNRGFVETAFVDVGDFSVLSTQAEGYAPQERLVYFEFQILTPDRGPNTLQAAGYYRPFRPLQNVLLTKSHPGFQVLYALEQNIKRGMTQANVTIVPTDTLGA